MTPACWSWPLPPFPLPNHRGPLVDWHAGRCAVCAARPATLLEDHAHGTQLTRGYLCQSCNITEGVSAAPVFVAYRSRPPTQMLGLLIRYRQVRHPIDRQAERDLENALSDGGGPRALSDALDRVGLTFAEWNRTLKLRDDLR